MKADDMYSLEKWLEDQELEAYYRMDYHAAGIYGVVLSKIRSMRVYNYYPYQSSIA